METHHTWFLVENAPTPPLLLKLCTIKFNIAINDARTLSSSSYSSYHCVLYSNGITINFDVKREPKSGV